MALEVNSLNYEDAHRYYIAYYSDTGSDQDKKIGKMVADSPKWSPFITKWQSEDSTIYDLDGSDQTPSAAAQEEIDELEEDGAQKSKKGGVAAGAVAGSAVGSAGIALAVAAKSIIPTAAANGTIIAAAIYAAVGIIFCSVAEVFRAQVKRNRELQERYIAKAEQDLQYNYEAADAKAQSITEMVRTQNAAANKVMETTGQDVTLSNAVADATADSNTLANLAALGQGDNYAGDAFNQLDEINNEMLNTIGEYDQILAEVNTSKSIVNSIKNEMPQFQKQRSNDKITEYLFAAGGAASVLGGMAGISAAMGANLLPPIAAGAIILFAAGMILFGLAAGRSFGEASKQKQDESDATNMVDKSAQTYQNASNASSSIREQVNEANTMYQQGMNMQGDMDKEDSNYNGPAV